MLFNSDIDKIREFWEIDDTAIVVSDEGEGEVEVFVLGRVLGTKPSGEGGKGLAWSEGEGMGVITEICKLWGEIDDLFGSGHHILEVEACNNGQG